MKGKNTLNIITNVIGFKLKDTITTIINPDGTIKMLKGGVRSTVRPINVEPISHKECNKKWFTNFNQDLLDKIVDYHKNN